METVEEVVVAPPCHIINNDQLSPVAKRKRTKRQRPHSPIPFTVSNNYNYSHRLSPSFSAASTAAADSSTTEEEDTARCLILLSRGHFLPKEKKEKSPDDHDHQYEYSKPNKTAAALTGGGGGAYACKTCNRVFSSFQALGGHRTSHKKPKNDKKTGLHLDLDDGDFQLPSSKKRAVPPSLSLQLSSTAGGSGGRQLPSPRIHECSYCGAEFASGQALGGHMRRHRAGPTSPLPIAAAAEVRPPEPKKPRNGLSLDLNFPAPEDESQRFGYGGARREKSPEKMMMTTTTPTLVDCHY